MSKTITKLTKTIAMAAIASFALPGVSQAQSNATTEMYYIFDIKTSATTQEIGHAISKGIKRHAPKMTSNFPLVMEPTPAEPKRFEIVDMADAFSQSPGIGGLMALARANGGGAQLKTAKCDGAVWIGRFTRDISNQTLSMSTCLFPYQGGYSLNVYGQDTHKKSRILSEKLGTIIAQGIVGKPQKWTENTFKNMRKKLYQKTGALAVLQEGQPQLNFTFKEEPVAATAPQPAAATQLVSQPVNSAPVVHSPAAVPATAAPAISCKGLSDAQCLAKMRAAE